MVWKSGMIGCWVLMFVWTGFAEAEDNKVSTGDLKTDEMMVKVQEQLKEIQSCSATLSTVFKMMGEVVEDDVDAVYQLPDRICLSSVVEGKPVPIMVVEGGVLWIYDPVEQLVTRFNRVRIFRETKKEVDAYVPDPLRPFRGLQWKTIRHVGEEKQGETIFQIFEATPEANLLSVQLPVTPAKVKLWFHAQNGLLHVVKMFDQAGNEIVVRRFDRVQLNPKVNARLFEFVIPAGVQVIDATDDTVDLLKQTDGH